MDKTNDNRLSSRQIYNQFPKKSWHWINPDSPAMDQNQTRASGFIDTLWEEDDYLEDIINHLAYMEVGICKDNQSWFPYNWHWAGCDFAKHSHDRKARTNHVGPTVKSHRLCHPITSALSSSLARAIFIDQSHWSILLKEAGLWRTLLVAWECRTLCCLQIWW